jgi:hypothetical protein
MTKRQILNYLDTHRNERAYVYASAGNVFNVSDGKIPEPRIVISNSGRTVANNAKRWAAAVISPPKSEKEVHALDRGISEEGAASIAPRVPHALVRYSERLQPGQQTQIANSAGPLRLYVYGRIEYADIFNVSHFTNFCFVYYGEMQDWPLNGGLGYNSTQARFCAGHNESN